VRDLLAIAPQPHRFSDHALARALRTSPPVVRELKAQAAHLTHPSRDEARLMAELGINLAEARTWLAMQGVTR
jgi:hypothetical protein